MQNHSQFRSYQEIFTSRQGKSFSEAEATEILCQVLLQLINWHDQGQSYGFISLETIAQDQVSNQIVLLQGGQFINGYVAPEVAHSGKGSQSGDVYALGVTIAVLLTGQTPHGLQNFDGTWNWGDRCVVSDQLEQSINIAIADTPNHRYADARHWLASLFPNVQVPVAPANPSTTAVISQSRPPQNATWGLMIGAGIIILCSALGFAVARLMPPQDRLLNNATSSQLPTPSPSIVPTVAISASPSPASTPTPRPAVSNTPTNPFENSSFPQSACGDSIPTDSELPTSLYPVFVEYSDNNLQRIKAQFCQDALPKIKKGTNKQAVQTASFTSRDRAVLFAEFLSKRFSGVEVGEPTILPSSRSRGEAVVVSRDRVSFASGASNAIVGGSISPNQKRQYILNCGVGQQLNASLLQGQANLRLIDPNGATVSSGNNNLGAKLSISGDYTVEVSSFDAVSFNLRIEVLAQ